jgi:hypothetical protein
MARHLLINKNKAFSYFWELFDSTLCNCYRFVGENPCHEEWETNVTIKDSLQAWISLTNESNFSGEIKRIFVLKL